MTRALLLIGAPGSGKSSTLEALSSELERHEVPHSTLESEQLSMGWPLLPAAAWIPSLASVLQAQLAAGRDLFLIAATPESASDLAQIRSAIPTSAVATVCLSAPPDLVAARIATREPDTWPGKSGLISHARTLATTIPTFPGITETIATAATTAPSIASHLAHDHLGVS
jgi:GTPase SAR1 family protein